MMTSWVVGNFTLTELPPLITPWDLHKIRMAAFRRAEARVGAHPEIVSIPWPAPPFEDNHEYITVAPGTSDEAICREKGITTLVHARILGNTPALHQGPETWLRRGRKQP